MTIQFKSVFIFCILLFFSCCKDSRYKEKLIGEVSSKTSINFDTEAISIVPVILNFDNAIAYNGKLINAPRIDSIILTKFTKKKFKYCRISRVFLANNLSYLNEESQVYIIEENTHLSKWEMIVMDDKEFWIVKVFPDPAGDNY